MADESTMREFTLRPPPASRFYVWGSDVRIQFQKGREREVVQWLRTWIDAYLEPEALKAEAIARKAQNDEDELSNPRITPARAGQPVNIKEFADAFFERLEKRAKQPAPNATTEIQPEVNTTKEDGDK